MQCPRCKSRTILSRSTFWISAYWLVCVDCGNETPKFKTPEAADDCWQEPAKPEPAKTTMTFLNIAQLFIAMTNVPTDLRYHFDDSFSGYVIAYPNAVIKVITNGFGPGDLEFFDKGLQSWPIACYEGFIWVGPHRVLEGDEAMAEKLRDDRMGKSLSDTMYRKDRDEH